MINKIISAGTFEAMDGIREGKNTLREVAETIANAFYKKNEENIKNEFGAELEIVEEFSTNEKYKDLSFEECAVKYIADYTENSPELKGFPEKLKEKDIVVLARKVLTGPDLEEFEDGLNEWLSEVADSTYESLMELKEEEGKETFSDEEIEYETNFFIEEDTFPSEDKKKLVELIKYKLS